MESLYKPLDWSVDICAENPEAGVRVGQAVSLQRHVRWQQIVELMEKHGLGVLHLNPERIISPKKRWQRIRDADESTTDVVAANVVIGEMVHFQVRLNEIINEMDRRTQHLRQEMEAFVGGQIAPEHSASHAEDFLNDVYGQSGINTMDGLMARIPHHSIQWKELRNRYTFVDNRKLLHRKHELLSNRDVSVGRFHKDGGADAPLITFAVSDDAGLFRNLWEQPISLESK